MRVAVTGGGGFIGTHLLARLVGAGIRVTLIGPNAGRSKYVAALIAAGAVRFAPCDASFSDESALRSAVRDANVLALLDHVAPAGSSDCSSEALERNVTSTVRILRLAEGHVRHVVF